MSLIFARGYGIYRTVIRRTYQKNSSNNQDPIKLRKDSLRNRAVRVIAKKAKSLPIGNPPVALTPFKISLRPPGFWLFVDPLATSACTCCRWAKSAILPGILLRRSCRAQPLLMMVNLFSFLSFLFFSGPFFKTSVQI